MLPVQQISSTQHGLAWSVHLYSPPCRPSPRARVLSQFGSEPKMQLPNKHSINIHKLQMCQSGKIPMSLIHVLDVLVSPLLIGLGLLHSLGFLVLLGWCDKRTWIFDNLTGGAKMFTKQHPITKKTMNSALRMKQWCFLAGLGNTLRFVLRMPCPWSCTLFHQLLFLDFGLCARAHVRHDAKSGLLAAASLGLFEYNLNQKFQDWTNVKHKLDGAEHMFSRCLRCTSYPFQVNDLAK